MSVYRTIGPLVYRVYITSSPEFKRQGKVFFPISIFMPYVYLFLTSQIFNFYTLGIHSMRHLCRLCCSGFPDSGDIS